MNWAKILEWIADAALAVALMTVIVFGVAGWVGIGSGLIDPYKIFSREPKAHIIKAADADRTMTSGMEVFRKKERGR